MISCSATAHQRQARRRVILVYRTSFIAIIPYSAYHQAPPSPRSYKHCLTSHCRTTAPAHAIQPHDHAHILSILGIRSHLGTYYITRAMKQVGRVHTLPSRSHSFSYRFRPTESSRRQTLFCDPRKRAPVGTIRLFTADQRGVQAKVKASWLGGVFLRESRDVEIILWGVGGTHVRVPRGEGLWRRGGWSYLRRTMEDVQCVYSHNRMALGGEVFVEMTTVASRALMVTRTLAGSRLVKVGDCCPSKRGLLASE